MQRSTTHPIIPLRLALQIVFFSIATWSLCSVEGDTSKARGQSGVKLNTPILDGSSEKQSRPFLKNGVQLEPAVELDQGTVNSPQTNPIQRRFGLEHDLTSGRPATVQKRAKEGVSTDAPLVQPNVTVLPQGNAPRFMVPPREIRPSETSTRQFSQPGAKAQATHFGGRTVDPNAETIKERYSNGVVRVERQVIQDRQKNYVNHGRWQFYLPSGRLSAQGFFQHGKKVGTWSRWVTTREVPLFKSPPFKQFQSPFLTTFVYEEDGLNGPWQIVDSAKRKVLEINLKNGKRHGSCTWFLSNGKKYQQIEYDHGFRHGVSQKWNIGGKLTESRNFIKGQQVSHITQFHRPGIKKLDYGVLAGQLETITPDDPWNIGFATEEKTGLDIKHGPAKSWYSNGQIKFNGTFDKDIREGSFTWYYINGQKQAEGTMKDGQQNGNWIWWHENGMRASSGFYERGVPSGQWQWWLATGKLLRTETMESEAGWEMEPREMKNASFQKEKSN